MAEKMMTYPIVNGIVQEAKRYGNSRCLGVRWALFDAVMLGACVATLIHLQ